MQKKKTNYTVLLTIAVVVVIVTLLSISYYKAHYGPLPYEQDYNELNAEQGLSGIDYEYKGPNLENFPPPPQAPSN
ncbi:hypothetical protein COV81_04325 [Candidatus Peregrinibacteria bacterium CG11_big_fil_rev_8_21_14_0_20_41_10]|nr:MAG: hypothetical protein AUK57_02175 [Candidatus Saccharibacteria bacterium CG2_30_41_52]PIQ78789.1 MAG: hypothetical protein COV81_04325 [Candidatus Peregrinibacteria bacterium CG11_big_fil_rev_8_21_14_0_20_41_10]PIZ74563.1 MAG: hypothetical protein COY06_04110 [Candidatus Peregrinibacteria bacterium CG_4_10_14_0_2_um_filter_41_8]PJC37849.1 MAG: hypothetical protein CO045_03235 [Candidatus Peregrinibacteria bacterium CG_4_9_14_0_2_um_filter_41_14]